MLARLIPRTLGPKPEHVQKYARLLLLSIVDGYLGASDYLARYNALPGADEDSRVSLPSSAEYIRSRFGSLFPEQAARLTDDDARVAVEIWRKRGAPRRTTALPEKWRFFAGLMDRLGIGPIKPGSLKTEWLTRGNE